MKKHLFTILSLLFLLLAICGALVDVKLALLLVCGVHVAGVGLLVYRFFYFR